MTFWSQLNGFIKRNFLLKLRNKAQTIPEIYNPIMLFGVLILFNFLFPSQYYEATDYQPIEFPLVKYQFANGYIVPDTSVTRQIGKLLSTKSLAFNSIKYYNSSKAMDQAYLDDAKSQSYIKAFGIVFGDQFPFEYTLRMDWNTVLFSDKKVNLFTDGNSCRMNDTSIFSNYKDCGGNAFVYNGLTTIQYMLDSIIKSSQYSNTTSSYPTYKIKNMQKKSYVREQVMFTIITSIYFNLLFTNSLVTFVTNIVAEKEKKIKEVMRMMGMYETAFWLSWIITYFLPFSIFNLFVVIILGAIGFFKTVNLTIIFFFLLELFSITTIFFGMFFSSFFKKSKTAGAATGSFYPISSLLYLVVFLPRQFGSYLPLGVQWLLSLVFPCAFSIAIDQALYTQAVYGSSFPADLLVKSVRPNLMSIMDCFIMLLVDCLLYFVLAIYLENVLPGEYGVAKPPWFFLMPSYWRDKTKRGGSNVTFLFEDQDVESNGNEDCEPITNDFKDKLALKIRFLVKEFQNQEKVKYNAIDKLNLDIYSGQITAILGHNGAGKTTLFNILTGLIKPNDGAVSFFNYNVFSPNDLMRIREMSGVCPQHDVLYDMLNSIEHLELYAKLKGIPKNEIKAKVDDLIEKVGLVDSQKTLSKNLSGGQKRKLSIAIALIGNPKVLILDEPTSGMDPQSRRAVWSLLQSMRQDKVILLATHFMDEADVLADRKAIITKGKLRCVGSSLFLKSKFGVGYHLNCITHESLSTEPTQISQFVREHVPECKLERYHGKEVSYTLPLNTVPKFQVLFDNLEKSSRSIGIDYFGISMTTLEEVFLSLEEANEETKNGDLAHSKLAIENDAFEFSKFDTASSSVDYSDQEAINSINNQRAVENVSFLKRIFSVQVLALIRLRFLLLIRNKLTFIFRYIAPIPNVVLAIALPKFIQTKIDYDPNDLPRQNLLVNDYANFRQPFSIYNYTNESLADILTGLVVNSALQPQPIKLSSNADYYVDFPAGSLSGLAFNSWSSLNLNDFVAYYNDSAFLSAPYLVNTITNLYASLERSHLVNATLSPFPKLPKQCDLLQFDSSSFSSLLMLGLGLIMPAVSFAVEIVHDKELKCRTQLKLSGVNFITYWGTSMFCFFIQYFILPLVLFTLIFAIPPLNIDAFSPGGAKLSVFLATIIYMPCILMVSMCLSFLFDKKETAIGVLTTSFVLLFIIPFMAVNLSQLAGTQVSNGLHLAFTFLDPIYGLVGTYSQISKIALIERAKACLISNSTDLNVPFSTYFEFKDYFLPLSHIFGLINLMIYSFLLYFLDSWKQGINLLNYLFDKKRLTSLKPNFDMPVNEDSDVHEERERISRLSNTDCPLVLKELRKVFRKSTNINEAIRCSGKRVGVSSANEKVAVKNLSLNFNYGEVFGLLGPNGAGKTTTISMITTEIQPDAGSIEILGERINLTNLNKFYKNIGFCPQHNPLYEELTLREHLILYASVKRLPKNSIQGECDKYMDLFGISEHANKKSKDLSGGTKRKLAFIIAMFASPCVALLDEPSTGMDPQSKRKFWNLITLMFKDFKKSAILTTHSMEEAEALCNRIGIIIKGELKCLGSSQYLKEKFGMGYTLETKIVQNNEQKLLDYVNHIFTNKATVSESFSNRYVFDVPKDSIKSLAYVFASLEKAKSENLLIEYNFSQCTLEQVFIKFAKEQHD